MSLSAEMSLSHGIASLIIGLPPLGGDNRQRRAAGETADFLVLTQGYMQQQDSAHSYVVERSARSGSSVDKEGADAKRKRLRDHTWSGGLPFLDSAKQGRSALDVEAGSAVETPRRRGSCRRLISRLACCFEVCYFGHLETFLNQSCFFCWRTLADNQAACAGQYLKGLLVLAALQGAASKGRGCGKRRTGRAGVQGLLRAGLPGFLWQTYLCTARYTITFSLPWRLLLICRSAR